MREIEAHRDLVTSATVTQLEFKFSLTPAYLNCKPLILCSHLSYKKKSTFYIKVTKALFMVINFVNNQDTKHCFPKETGEEYICSHESSRSKFLPLQLAL